MLLFQDADAKLTLTRVATAPVLVAEIAKATGQKLEVSPLLGMEILMVSVDGARAGDVLTKLAIAATAVWQPMEGGYRLVPDSAARGIEASAERARRTQAINEGVKKRMDATAAKGNDAGFGGMMSNRSVDAFVPMLETATLASMEEGGRIVFATNPTAVQRPLRGNVMPIVAELIAQHNAQAKTMAGQMGEMPEAMSSFMSGPIGDRIKQMSRPVTGTPTKVMVVATKGGIPFFGGNGLDIRLEARVYGTDGKVLIEETGTLDSEMMNRIMAMVSKKPAVGGTEKTTPIEYSPEAKALAESSTMPSFDMSSAMGVASVGKGKIPPVLRNYLMTPERNEPLALVPGEGLAALSKARRKPLVACIPDEAYPAMLGAATPNTVEDVEKGFTAGPMRLVPDTTFYVVKASDPDGARRYRLDRIALSALLRAVGDHETPNLSELAAFAARTPDPGQNRVSQAMLGLFAPSSLGSMTGMVSWPALRLYDALAPSQRQSLENGAQIPFNTLSPAGQAALRTLVYGATTHLSTGGASDENDPITLGIRMAMGGSSTSAGEEPTEVAPDGLPAGGYLQASVATESIIRPVTADGASASIMGTDELAMMRLMSASPMADKMGDALKLPESGILGSRKAWKIRGYIANGTYVSATLDDDNAPKSGRTVRLSDLPVDIQDQVAKRVEQLKKSPLGAIMSMDPGMFGGPKAKP